ASMRMPGTDLPIAAECSARPTRREWGPAGALVVRRIEGAPTSLHLKDAALEREQHRMGTVLGAKFGKDALHVRLHRAFGDVEGFRDFPIGIATRQLLQHLHLARRETDL